MPLPDDPFTALAELEIAPAVSGPTGFSLFLEWTTAGNSPDDVEGFLAYCRDRVAPDAAS